jgi:hypothetical protein
VVSVLQPDSGLIYASPQILCTRIVIIILKSLHDLITNTPTQSLIQWVPEAVFPGIKRPGREADHSPPSGADVKNAWSYTSTPPYVFVTWCLFKHRIRLRGVVLS